MFWKTIYFFTGKYVSVNSRGDVTGRADAIGPQEQIDIVVEDEKTALQGHNGYFLAINESGELKALSSKAREKEIFKLRTDFVNKLVSVPDFVRDTCRIAAYLSK